MSKNVPLFFSLFTFGLMAASFGCAHKPAYSDIDVNRNSRNQNQETEAPRVAQPPPSEPSKPKIPAFMAANGTVKDLPSYPRAARINVQIGPIQDADMMALTLRTRDSMESVQAFYTQQIKENQWTVVDQLLDPEVSQWTLKKDESNAARVQAKKDPINGSIDILLVRTQAIAAQPK